uniref:Uncharacterized protein n=1 Tax=Ascaris lumbricoides TaxID=6252 RepID=A0A0M3HY21_ASCLU
MRLLSYIFTTAFPNPLRCSQLFLCFIIITIIIITTITITCKEKKRYLIIELYMKHPLIFEIRQNVLYEWL